MTVDDVWTFQGQRIGVSLADGTRVDDAVLEGFVESDAVWLHTNGVDVFPRLEEILDFWEVKPPPR